MFWPAPCRKKRKKLRLKSGRATKVPFPCRRTTTLSYASSNKALFWKAFHRPRFNRSAGGWRGIQALRHHGIRFIDLAAMICRIRNDRPRRRATDTSTFQHRTLVSPAGGRPRKASSYFLGVLSLLYFSFGYCLRCSELNS